MIQIGPDQVTACDPHWLRSTVRDAARGVNVPDWFADDIVQGVVHFLKVQYRGTVIAIESLFEVRVLKVHTQNRKGKPRRTRFRQGYTKDWKKAIVTLDAEHRIEFF